MARRRTILGKPLLVATGLLLAHASQANIPEVDAPMLKGEICVEVVPPSAQVQIDGTAHTGRCATVESASGTIEIVASAPGYLERTSTHTLEEKLDLKISLVPDIQVVGNLMPPPKHNTKVCVDTPRGVTVLVEGAKLNRRCITVETGYEFTISLSSPGYAEQTSTHMIRPSLEFQVYKDDNELKIQQKHVRPVGNLMPPRKR